MAFNHRVDLRALANHRLIRFLSTGALNTVFGYSVYAALIFIGLPYLISLFISTIAGIVFNYFSFGRLVFHGSRGWQVFVKFVTAYGGVYVVNAFLLRMLTENLLLSPYIGQIICMPVAVVLSWVAMNCWVYKKD